MKRKTLIVAGAILIMGVLSGRVVFAEGILDGKTYSGQVGEKDLPIGQAQRDDFVFNNGQFASTLCQSFGYGEGSYEAVTNGDVVLFSAKTTRSDGGTKIWSGTIRNGDIQGAIVTLESGTTTEGWFEGKEKELIK